MSGTAKESRATIGVLFESLLGGSEEELWIAISQAAKSFDANLVSFVGNGVAADGDALYSMAADRSVDGVIAVSSALWIDRSPDALPRLFERFAPRPVVSIGRAVPGADCLLVQGGEGIRALVDHLVEVHGRTRIAFIRGPPESEEAEERFAGYRGALEAHGIPYRPALVRPGDFRRPAALDAVRSLQEQRVEFDALVGANDYMTIHAMRELQRWGVRVPDDVAVAGFDDIPETIAVTPTLTTARQPLRAVGKEAVRTVLARIRGERAPERSLFPAQPVVRRSCGCLHQPRVRAAPPAGGSGRPAMAALGAQLDALFPEVKEVVQSPGWAHELLESLGRELAGERTDRLSLLLEELISRFDPRRGVAGQWHEIVDAACELLRPPEPGADAWRAGREDAMSLVASLAEQRQMRFSVLRAQGYKGVIENFYWNVLLDEGELRRTLLAGLPELGIESLWVARWSDAARDRATLSLRFGGAERATLDLPDPFPPGALLSAAAPGRRFEYLVFSLLPSTGQDGFALFETVALRSVPDPSLLHELRRRISVTALMTEAARHAGALEERVAVRTRELQEAQTQLLDAAHQAGMAEIAVGALHNVGNLLNSVSVSAETAAEILDGSRLEGLLKANELLAGQQGDLGAFFARDPRGRLLPQYYAQLGAGLVEEQARLRMSLAELLERTALIRETIRNLQEYAHNGLDMLLREETDLAGTIELALEVQAANLAQAQVEVHREYDREAPHPVLPRAKVVHVMVNLVKNAIEAMERAPADARRLRVEVARDGEGVRVRIEDTGEGIPRENLERIFSYGFTTKAQGSGFGLHTCANYVHQMGGTITAESDGPGRGAAFTVTFEPGA